jgi:predicted nucleotidyltransferase
MQFEEFINKIINYYHGKVSIVLFGSRVRGDFWPSSDYDIIVILEKVDDEIEEASKLYSMKRGFSADIIVITPDKLNNKIIETMLKYKKVLYDGLEVFKEMKI